MPSGNDAVKVDVSTYWGWHNPIYHRNIEEVANGAKAISATPPKLLNGFPKAIVPIDHDHVSNCIIMKAEGEGGRCCHNLVLARDKGIEVPLLCFSRPRELGVVACCVAGIRHRLEGRYIIEEHNATFVWPEGGVDRPNETDGMRDQVGGGDGNNLDG